MSHPSRTRSEESGAVQSLDTREIALVEAFGKYRLLGALGHGGMADVYLAVADGPEGFRKLCVLKLLKESMAQDDEFRAMFLDEARLAARLNHPNVVQTFEVGELDGRLMIAMEYIEGQPITRIRRRLTPEQFPLTAYISVLCDVLEALEYAHTLTDFDGSSLGIVHRDVSPHNIIVGYDSRAKLVDFGIAKSSAAMQMTQAGVLKGKVGYMAPEQAVMGDVDGRADVFGVGVILWEAIAGRRLVDGMSSNDVLLRRAEGKDPRIAEVVPSVDPELAAICDRAMARFPADRYASAAELVTDLEQWLKKHGEAGRKEWSKALREAFAPEREQVRALVEHRMTSSGTQQSLLTTSSSRVLASGSGSGDSPSLTPLRHPSGSGASTLPAVEAGNSAGPHGATASQNVPAWRRAPLPVILGIAACVAIGTAASAYVVRSHSEARPAATDPPLSEPTEKATAAQTATAIEAADAGAPAAVVPNTQTTTAAPTSRSNPNRAVNVAPPVRPAPPPPVAHTTTHPAHPTTPTPAPPPTTASPAPTTPTGLTPPVPPKTPSRTLDEKDPYAP